MTTSTAVMLALAAVMLVLVAAACAAVLLRVRRARGRALANAFEMTRVAMPAPSERALRVELIFADDDSAVGVAPGTPAFDAFQELAAALLAGTGRDQHV